MVGDKSCFLFWGGGDLPVGHWRVICVVLVARFVASQKDQEEPEAPSEGGSQHWKSWSLIPKKGDAKNWELLNFGSKSKG